jgi:hypothetical protein
MSLGIVNSPLQIMLNLKWCLLQDGDQVEDLAGNAVGEVEFYAALDVYQVTAGRQLDEGP